MKYGDEELEGWFLSDTARVHPHTTFLPSLQDKDTREGGGEILHAKQTVNTVLTGTFMASALQDLKGGWWGGRRGRRR